MAHVSTRALLDQQTSVETEMRALHVAHADGVFPPEAASAWAALQVRHDGLKAAVSRAALLDEADRRSAGQPVGGSGDALLDRERSKVSFGDAVRAQLGATDAGAGRAREMSAEVARRSGKSPAGLHWSMGTADIEKRVTASTGSGGNLIATMLDSASFIARLYQAVRVRQLGATVLSGLTANLDIPRLKSSTTTGWVAEGAPLTAADAVFDKVSLRPHTAGVLSEVSRLMILQATPDVDTLLANDMARMLAITLDQAAINGTGAGSNMPLGILNTAGIGGAAIGANGGPLTYAAVLSLMGLIQDQNAEVGALAFLTNYKVRRAADGVVTTQGAPLGEAVVFQNMPRAFTTSVPSNGVKGTGTGLSSLVYGNFSDLLIGLWSELDVLVNPYNGTSYAAGNVQIRAMMTCDIAVRHPESFAAMTDIAA